MILWSPGTQRQICLPMGLKAKKRRCSLVRGWYQHSSTLKQILLQMVPMVKSVAAWTSHASRSQQHRENVREDMMPTSSVLVVPTLKHISLQQNLCAMMVQNKQCHLHAIRLNCPQSESLCSVRQTDKSMLACIPPAISVPPGHTEDAAMPACTSPAKPAISAARMAAGLALPVASMTRTPAAHAARMASAAAGWL